MNLVKHIIVSIHANYLKLQFEFQRVKSNFLYKLQNSTGFVTSSWKYKFTMKMLYQKNFKYGIKIVLTNCEKKVF